MGEYLAIKCKRCNYSQEFYLGVGMQNFCEEQLFDLTTSTNLSAYCSADEKPIVVALIKSGRVHLGKDFGYKIYRCNQCQATKTAFMFDLLDVNGNIVYRGNQFCQQCRGSDIEICEESNIKCPTCGKDVQIVEFGNWD